MISMGDFDRIVDAAESVEWYVSWSKELTDKKREFYFRYSSPAGEDFSFTVFAGSLGELITGVEDEYYSFDISEHALSLYGEPSDLQRLLDDATDIQAAIGRLVAELMKLTMEE